MHISGEGKISILLGLLALLGAGAMMVWPDQIWIGWGLMGFAAFGFIVLAIYHGVEVAKARQGATLAVIALLGMVVTGIAFLAFAGAYFYDRSKGPVEWTLDEGSPLNWQRVRNGPLLIMGFQIKGRNRWDAPILPSAAMVRSDVSGRTVALRILMNGAPADVTTAAIPGYTNFTLTGYLPEGQVPLDHFLPEFSKFTLMITYQSGKLNKTFSENAVQQALALVDKASQPKIPAVSGVIPRR